MYKEDLVNKFTSIIKEESKRKEKVDSIKEKEIDMSKNNNSKLQWIFNHSKILDTIWGCILLVIISLIIYNVCFSSKYINSVKNMKPFSDKATIGSQLKDVTKSGKWSESKITAGLDEAIRVHYTGVANTASNTTMPISIDAYYITNDDNVLGKIDYSINNKGVNPIEFLHFLYNVQYNDIKIENINSIYDIQLTQSMFNDMRSELGLNKVDKNNIDPTPVKQKIEYTKSTKTYNIPATTKVDLDLMKEGKVCTDTEIDNPGGHYLSENTSIAFPNEDDTIEAFLNTKTNGKQIKQWLSAMNITGIDIKDRKAYDDFYLFVNGQINNVDVSLRFRYINKSLSIMDSDVINYNDFRISNITLRKTLFGGEN